LGPLSLLTGFDTIRKLVYLHFEQEVQGDLETGWPGVSFRQFRDDD